MYSSAAGPLCAETNFAVASLYCRIAFQLAHRRTQQLCIRSCAKGTPAYHLLVQALLFCSGEWPD